MLDLIGRLADGWVPSLGYSPPENLPEMQRRIDAGATRAGRDPAEIRRAYNVAGMIGPEGDGLLEGPVSKWVEELTRFALELGMDTFIYWPSEGHERQIELFANEVVPAVREAVRTER
jgi:alkanesulfonate monooxygenase SsuD/methylene tetrahydromethanopterin reductase-like flavin-dependent oxidoreductase (luciferase family)